MISSRLALGAALAAALAAASPARAAGYDLAFGAESVQGEFLSDESRSLDQLFLQMEFGGAGSRITIRAPYLRIDKTGNVTWTPDGPIILGAGGPGAPPWQESEPGEKEAGLGDIYVRNDNYLFKAGKGKQPTLVLFLDLKYPAADQDEGLGTGELDWGGGLDYTQPLSKIIQLLGAASYRVMGQPEGVEFEERLRFMLGLGFVTSKFTWRITGESQSPVLNEVPLFDATGVQTGTAEVEDYQVARGEMVYRGKTGGSTRLYVLAGLNDSSPAIGFGLVMASKPQ